MPINSAIVKKLKTGSIKSVILFADTMEIPAPPYVVVKTEVGRIPGTRQWRIFAHTHQGRLDEIEKYIFSELPELLLSNEKEPKVRLKDDEGRLYQLHSGEWFDVRLEDSDKTIYMERIFFLPFGIS